MSFAHKLSYTSFAPPGFVLGSTPLHLHKPPAPQELQLRASQLHELQSERTLGLFVSSGTPLNPSPCLDQQRYGGCRLYVGMASELPRASAQDTSPTPSCPTCHRNLGGTGGICCAGGSLHKHPGGRHCTQRHSPGHSPAVARNSKGRSSAYCAAVPPSNAGWVEAWGSHSWSDARCSPWIRRQLPGTPTHASPGPSPTPQVFGLCVECRLRPWRTGVWRREQQRGRQL